MTYSRAFFDLQLRFADRVARLSGLALPEALLDYTNLYIRLGLGRDFDPGHPVWLEYLQGLRTAADGGHWTHRFCLARPREVEVPGLVARFGCFAYAALDAGDIRMHFHAATTDGGSPLRQDGLPARLAEQRALFQHVKSTRPDAPRVVGVSWLYNLPAYRRCFPPDYLATAKPAGPRFRNMPLWGQFLDRHGEVRPSMAAPFLARLSRQTAMHDIAQCFPLQPLAVEAPAAVFYAFHAV